MVQAAVRSKAVVLLMFIHCLLLHPLFYLFIFFWGRGGGLMLGPCFVLQHFGLNPSVKYFTDRSKAVLLLWIFYGVFSVLCLLCFVRVCLYVLCGYLLGTADLLALVCGV